MKSHAEHSPFHVFALVALLMALSGGAWGGDQAPTAEDVAAQQAAQQQADAIAAIISNRAGTITDLVFQWSPAATALGYPSNDWAVEFAAILQGANDEQLYNIQNATSYNAVRAILQGRSVPVSLDGVAGTASLGDTNSDLVYTPVTPCRILDTRYGTGTYLHPPAGSSRSYYVYGTAANLAPQGHTAGTGCSSPKGEPAAIAANFAVVPSSTGHIRVWPSYYAMPTASFINYQAGNNLANAGIIAVCYGCGYDINVYNSTTTDYLADVMGYYYAFPTAETTDRFWGSGSNTLTALSYTCTNQTGGYVSVYATGPGTITVTAQASIYFNHTYLSTSYAYAYIGTTSADCTFSNYAQGYHATMWITPSSYPSGATYNTLPVSRTFTVTTSGSHSYYLNGIGSTDAYFWYAAMQARFHPNP